MSLVRTLFSKTAEDKYIMNLHGQIAQHEHAINFNKAEQRRLKAAWENAKQEKAQLLKAALPESAAVKTAATKVGQAANAYLASLDQMKMHEEKKSQLEALKTEALQLKQRKPETNGYFYPKRHYSPL
jgi:hypothetical protein